MPHPPRLDTTHPGFEYTRTIAPCHGYGQHGEAEGHEEDVPFKLSKAKGSEEVEKEEHDDTGYQSCL